MNKCAAKGKFIISFAKFLLICYYMAVLEGLIQSSGRLIRSFPACIIQQRLSMHIYHLRGMVAEVQ
jgi:hypothetical protein